jgi:hypothetical protein
VQPEFLTRLRQFAAGWLRSTQALGWGLLRGLHRWVFCGSVYASGNLGVPSSEVLYVAPKMVAHYVEAHGYVPPAEFVAAVLDSPPPETEQYRQAVEQFRRTGPRPTEYR